MTKFIVNNRTDALKTDINLFFTTTNCRLALSSLTHQIKCFYPENKQQRTSRVLAKVKVLSNYSNPFVIHLARFSIR